MEIPVDDYALGAAVATDLVTTSPTVRESTGEALPTPISLAVFLAGHGLQLEAPLPPTKDDVFQVQLLRREVRGIVETETADQAVSGCRVLLRRAGLAPVLHRASDGKWQWHVPTAPGASLADELAAFISTALLGVVRALGHERFRACEAPGCRGVFVDTSRAGRRRYCMPELCGNRHNVAKHRARRQARSVDA
ncbi:CGNR zinc finger domain-containing protein [Allokutzneria multivorans]|uniref:CGNR zinc finger domain-containing protein n=1 Tax=Allokutzneria multivorans TaxID=1142134 RepID=A0ABP7U0A9_9PSEU